MEQTNGREEDLHVNVIKLSSIRVPTTLQPTSSGKSSTPKGSPRTYSPSSRKLRVPRKEKSSWWKLQCSWVNDRSIYLFILIMLWMYIMLQVQIKWSRSGYNMVDKSDVGSVQKMFGVSRIVDVFNSTILDSKECVGNLVNYGMLGSSQQNGKRLKHVIAESESNSNSESEWKEGSDIRTGVLVEEGVPRINTSYGFLIGPFEKIEDRILGWTPDRRKRICDKNGEFGQMVSSRSFVLIFHELSLTGAPLSMMELATEILSCGGTVSVVALNMKGGLLRELDRRGIKVLADKGKDSFRVSRKADLIIAGSSVCSTWIEDYLSHSTDGSNKILWWIMENRREYFDRAMHLLNEVKMLLFLSESQYNQWLIWCEEEQIQLKTKHTTVSLSINDEVAFVAGISCSLNISSFSVDEMQEKRKLLRIAVRKELGLADSDMLVLSLSSINPGKGQQLLLESLLLGSEQKQPTHLESTSTVNHDREIENILLKTYNNDGNASKIERRRRRGKRRKKNSKSSKVSSISSTSIKRSIITTKFHDYRKLRKLLSDSVDGRKEPSLKVLFGSVGSKSNKIFYVKGMLKFLSQHSNFTKSVLWSPATTYVSSLYAAADAYVINAQGLGETFGRVTIEAMAFGLPVLGTNAGGTKEIVEDKVTGFLHPTGSEGIKPLAQNLQFLLYNPSAREQLGRNGRMKAEKMYLKHHMFEKLAEALAYCIA